MSDAATTEGGAEADAAFSVRLLGPACANVGVESCFQAEARGRGAEGARFEWLWGDGFRGPGGSRACHRWDSPGDRLLSVLAQGAGGERADASRVVVVVPAPAVRRPTRATALRLDDRAATVLEEPLPPEVLRGKRLFYGSVDPRTSRTSYLSCASCHLDEAADGLTWDFTQRGEGLRNTIPLFGRGGMAHGPVHWTGNFDEIQDFEGDIRTGQGGRGFLTDAQWEAGDRSHPLGLPKAGLSEELDALAAYVASLRGWPTSPFRRDGDPDWEAAVARGEALFRSSRTGCADCHVPGRYTDSAFGVDGEPALHDVGTATEASGGRLGGPLPGFDTPTLRGLWDDAPYLHDGRAPTLRDVLTPFNPEDRHGRTSGLTEAELDDLITFLLAL